ncbi:hypothetical protein L209DRAFT_758687 [Thermothelomyces heterothallicus CBS 203.75]
MTGGGPTSRGAELGEIEAKARREGLLEADGMATAGFPVEKSHVQKKRGWYFWWFIISGNFAHTLRFFFLAVVLPLLTI